MNPQRLMLHLRRCRFGHYGRCGMSLVEVTLAIGILSFSLVAMMGLLPVGLSASRQSIEKAVELEIRQTMQSYLLSHPFSELAETGVFDYDPEGRPVDASSPSHEKRYAVSYRVTHSTDLPVAQAAPYLLTVQLEIRNQITGQTARTSLHLPDNGL